MFSRKESASFDSIVAGLTEVTTKLSNYVAEQEAAIAANDKQVGLIAADTIGREIERSKAAAAADKIAALLA